MCVFISMHMTQKRGETWQLSGDVLGQVRGQGAGARRGRWNYWAQMQVRWGWDLLPMFLAYP